jgi:hypothetical protein
VKEKCTREKKTMKEKKKTKDLKGVNLLLQIKQFWTAKNNSTFCLGASLGDPKRSISVVRFMGILNVFLFVKKCIAH